MTARITGHNDVNLAMADAIAKGAQESREHSDDHHRGAEFLYQNELTDAFGQSYFEVSGNVQAVSNEVWDETAAEGRAVVRANEHLMNAVRSAEQAIRGIR